MTAHFGGQHQASVSGLKSPEETNITNIMCVVEGRTIIAFEFIYWFINLYFDPMDYRMPLVQ